MQGENKNIYDDDGMSLNTRQTPYVPANNKTPYNGNADMTVPQKAQISANNDKNDSEKAGLFDGISKAQVLAGALASVTSMLLSSKIGIAGSVIGVAVGSVVSTVASTVYKNILNNSANALKNSSVFGGNDYNESDAEKTHIAGYNDTTLDKTVIDTPLKSYLSSQNEIDTDSNDINADNNIDNNESTLRVAPDELIEKNAERHKKQLRNRMIIFSIVASLIAVAITAILINAFTGGEGIGQKTDPIILPSSSSVSSNKADSTDTDKIQSLTTPSKKQQDSDIDSDDKISSKKSIDNQSTASSESADSDSAVGTASKANGTSSSSTSDRTGTSKSDSSSTNNANSGNNNSDSNANSSKPSSDSNSSSDNQSGSSNAQQPSTPSQNNSSSSDSSSATTSGS